MKKNTLLTLIIFFVFFIAGSLTLKDYGISWDEPTHFKRGQAYLWYFLTGEKNYHKLPPYDLERAKIDPSYHERSFYQNDAQDYSWHMEHDGDHPALNDILASVSNYIFYQKLGILGDIESFHIFEVFASAVLVAILFFWAAETFGIWVGIFSSMFMATYPLFWAESHFNVKDPIETLFFTLAIYFFWKAINKYKARFVIYSSIFAGMALSTKFNIFFAPIIVLPWLLVIFASKKKEFIYNIFSKRLIISFIIFPLIMFGIFFIHWPWLWQDIVVNTKEVFGYYKSIGMEQNPTPSLLLAAWDFYAPRWILFTTQPLMLFSFLVGLVLSIKRIKEKYGILMLWFFWFVITILRVMLPGTSIYGGVRQIMEYIPPMALIAGFGLNELILLVRKSNKHQSYFSKLEIIVCVGIFAFLISTLIKFHPNENVYFNDLSGGLKKNVDSGFPAAGFSFGNAYLQGVNWINKNVEKNAKLALIQGTMLNIPQFTVRNDIQYSNQFWSGINREGEYLIEITYNYNTKAYPYVWGYVEKFLKPVYEVKVEGAAIAKVWKNDLAHTYTEYRKKEDILSTNMYKVFKKENVLNINLNNPGEVTRITIGYTGNVTCNNPKGYVEVLDEKGLYKRLEEPFPYNQMEKVYNQNDFSYFFLAERISAVRFVFDDVNSCALMNPKISVYVLE